MTSSVCESAFVVPTDYCINSFISCCDILEAVVTFNSSTQPVYFGSIQFCLRVLLALDHPSDFNSSVTSITVPMSLITMLLITQKFIELVS